MHEVAGRWGPRSLLLWAGLFVSAAFTYFAVRGIDFGVVRDSLAESNYWWLAPALAALSLCVAVRAVRWQLLFRRETRPPLGPVASAMLVGLFCNCILPVRAGEVARIVVLNQRSRTSRVEAVGTVVLERALDVLCLLVLLFVIAPSLPPVSWLWPAAVLGVVLVLGLALTAWVLARWGDRPIRAALRPLTRLGLVGEDRVRRAAANLSQGLAGLRDWRLLAAGLVLTTLSWLLLGLSMWFVLRAFALGLSPVAGLLVAIAVNIGMILPSTAAAVGVYEASVLVALSVYGVPKEQALSYALVAHMLNFVPFVVVGALVLHAHGAALRRAATT